MSKILVIGSTSSDYSVCVDEFPSPGETILGEKFNLSLGGKGANQAVAASRAGGEVSFMTCLGSDDAAIKAITSLNAEGIDTSLIQQAPDSATGSAMIFVNKHGENAIVVAPQANAKLSPHDVELVTAHIKQARIVVLQFEIPMQTVLKAIDIATLHEVMVIVNAAPAAPIPLHYAAKIDVLIVNQTEAQFLTNSATIETLAQAHSAIIHLQQQGFKDIVLTMGEQGALIATQSLIEHVGSVKVDVVDTTAAGDTYVGVMATALCEGKNLIEAAQLASVAASISITKIGAQAAIPMRDAIEEGLGVLVK